MFFRARAFSVVTNFVLPKSRRPNCGIVGLPNVGKSTIANALAKRQIAQTANYPFCTIEPNVARVEINDDRLELLAKIGKSQNIVRSQLEFVDIAGLIKGAHSGQGLGNRFLGNIRTTSMILHVVRCYQDDSIIHVENKIDPISDIDVINTELILADLESLDRRKQKLVRKKDKESTDMVQTIDIVSEGLQQGRMGFHVAVPDELRESFFSLDLITAKPTVYLCNVDEGGVHGNAFTDLVKERSKAEGTRTAVMCGKLEEELASMTSVAERSEFMQSYGLQRMALDTVVRECMDALNMITYYTVGPEEARAWVIPKGFLSPQAAGVIHSDLQRGFIMAEVIGYDEYVASKGTAHIRKEGREYVIQDGDIAVFRFNKT